jgi:hypothetical protein
MTDLSHLIFESISTETNQWRIDHGLDPICPECGKETKLYADESTPTQNRPRIETFFATKCCDVVLKVVEPDYWDIP